MNKFSRNYDYTRRCTVCKDMKLIRGGYNHPRKFKCSDCLTKDDPKQIEEKQNGS